MRRAVAVVVSCLLGGALMLTGCGQTETEPKPHEAPSASPSPTVSPAPTMPAAAKEHSKAGAIAFVRHFLQVMAIAGSTGDTKSFDALYVKECAGCLGVSEIIQHTYSRGGKLSGGEWKPTSFQTYGFDGNRFPVDAIVDYEEQRVTKRSGGTTTTVPASTRHLHYFELAWTGSSWTVAALDGKS